MDLVASNGRSAGCRLQRVTARREHEDGVDCNPDRCAKLDNEPDRGNCSIAAESYGRTSELSGG